MILVYNVFTRREQMVLVRVHMHGSSEQFVFTCREGMALTRVTCMIPEINVYLHAEREWF